MARSSSKLRVALLGLGRAGGALHLPALLRCGAFAEVSAFDPLPERRPRAAALGAELLEDVAAALGPTVDAVVIATPDESHAELATAALRAGKAVYLEKPMATSVRDAAAVAALAASSGRTLQLGFAYRHHPLWRRVAALVRDGRLRPPLQVRAEFSDPRGGEGWNSPVVSLAPHHLDLVGWVTGAPLEAVLAEEGGGLTASWADGTRLHGVYAEGPPRDEVTLADDRGSIRVARMRRPWLSGRGLRLGTARRPDPRLVRALAARSGWEPAFELALASFARAAMRQSPASPEPHDGVVAVVACEAILRSLRTRAVEPLADIEHGIGIA